MDEQLNNAAKALDKNIQQAYRHVFRGRNKKVNESGREVLADLRKFCYATKGAKTNDPIELARVEGRREAMYHIMDRLETDYEELYSYATDYTPYDEELY